MKYKKLYSYLLTFLLALSLFPKQLASSASYGFIYGAVTGPVISGVTITIKGVSPTTGTWTLTTNANGTYYSSNTTTTCVLPCPGVYTVTASKAGAACTFSDPITVELKNCCGSANSYYQANFKSTSTEKKYGIIYGYVSGAVKEGVTITIEGVSPTTGTWTVTTDANGKYYSSSSTACVLPCPGTFKVTASKTGYAFSAPVSVDLKTCCGSGGSQANFTSTSTAKKYGLIYGYVSGAVKEGVTITITAVSPATGTWTVTTDANGKYQSSTSTSINCALPCPGKYKVSASKTGSYAFGEPQLVELTTCCGSGGSQVNFTATSTEKKYGIIYGAVTGAVVAGVTITIEGVSPTTGTWTVTTDANGKYYSSSSTACVLPCPGTFKVTASKTGYAFSAPVSVDLKICCGSGGSQANFTSTSTAKKYGLIYGYVSGAVKEGVTITITAVSPATGTWTVTTDANGKYQSSTSTSINCALPCPGKYKVSASKTGSYAFGEPQLVELTTCCGSGGSQVNFTATSTEKKYGIIYGAVTGAVVAGVTITIEGVSPTTGTWTVTTDANGKYYSSSSTACVLPCPGTFKVTASKTGYAFSAPVSVDLKICCGSGGSQANFTSTSTAKKYGLIYGYVSGAVKEGVTITITAVSPATGTWTVTTDANGKYQSSTSTSINCALPCPGKYKVSASKTGSYAFGEPQLVELTTCCGSGGSQVNFTATSTEKKYGIIYGAVTGAVVAGVTITIEGVSPTTGTWTVTTDANGKYYSSSSTACVLPCPGTFKVTASKTGYAFSAPVSVDLKICCGSGGSQANFTSTSTAKKYGLIYGYVSGAVKEGVTITITAVSPATGTWTVTTDANGKYQSSTSTSINCALPCPGKYKVSASKTGSYAFGEPQLVELTTCCGSGGSQVNFTATSTEKKYGIIYGAVTGAVVAGVTITIEGVSPTTGTWTVTTDANGKYYSSSSTACVLPCPGTFKVTASKTGYAFSAPVSVDLKICCGSGGSQANFTATSTEKKMGVIYGSVSGVCIEEVTIVINGVYPTEGQWVFKTDKNGKYTTVIASNCILPCPGKFVVLASKPDSTCKFSDPVVVELKTCCGSGEYGRADFKSELIEAKGRMIGNIMGSKTPVTISIIQEGGGQGWVFQTDASGFYDTGCVLPCPGSYIVIPSVPGSDFSFSPPYQNVKLEKCCINGYLRVDFMRTLSTKNHVFNQIEQSSNTSPIVYPEIMWYLSNDTKPLIKHPI